MENKNERSIRVQLTEDANEFLDKVSPAAARKIEFVIRRVMSGDKDRTIFKKLEGTDIWEFRILYAGTAYRLFAFWDTDSETLIIARTALSRKRRRRQQRRLQKRRGLGRNILKIRKEGDRYETVFI